jgi:7,8-dihydropterin-6-yl-methyl-4-(beta-D-ribofuranosyl)aminobenzene 5'-phosphate synthase
MRSIARLALPLLLLSCRSAPPAEPGGDRIQILYDAFGRGVAGTTPDWGFSCLIRAGGKTILFDAGWDAAIFARNVEALGVDLRTVDFAVGSHAHPDHLTGFQHVLKVNPGLKVYLPDDFYAGSAAPLVVKAPTEAEAKALGPDQTYYGGKPPGPRLPGAQFTGANVEYVKESRPIAPGVTLIATRSELLGYYSKYPPNTESPRMTGLPELSLALATPRGEILITGCSHSSVETIARECRRVRGGGIDLLVGGFHLFPYDEVPIRQTAAALKGELGVRRVAPGHCTGHTGFTVFREVYGAAYLYAGLGTTLVLTK